LSVWPEPHNEQENTVSDTARNHLSRRRFLQASAAATAGAMGAGLLRGEAPRRPNILFILTDDQRFDTMSCLGHPFLKTPHMDRIRNEGALLANAFVTTSLCSPARASFLTGMYAHSHGVIGNRGQEYDPDKTPSFPQLLQQAGYETGFVGKWHQAPHANPRKGFDYWLSFKGQGQYTDPALNENGRDFKATGYITDLLTDYAVGFLNKQRHKPFCLVLSHKAIHGPFTPAPRHENLYEGVVPPKPVSWDDDLAGKPAWQRGPHRPAKGKKGAAKKGTAKAGEAAEERVPDRRAPGPWQPSKSFMDYYRALAAVDEGIGKILAALARTGQLDDTVIVFAGDNGYFKGEHGRGDKRLAYEEALRIPFLLRYPRLVKGGATVEQMVLNIDLAPTLLDLAGVPIPPHVQGRSMKPLLEGKSPADWRKSWLYEYWVDLTPTIPRMVGVRTQTAKLVRYPDADCIDEMYDLAKDRHEMHNLANEPACAEMKRTLQAELDRLMKETGYRNDVPRPRDAAPKARRADAPRGVLLDVEFGPSGKPPADAGPAKLAIKSVGRIQSEPGRDGRSAARFAGQQALELGRQEQLDPSVGPWIVSARVKSEGDGVVLAHGGASRGYLLAVREGKCVLVVHDAGGTRRLQGRDKIAGRWAHLLVVLDESAARLYVDGRPAARSELDGGIDELPNDGLSIGRDSGSPVSEELSPRGFVGLVESVRCLRQEVDDAEAARLAGA